MRPAKLAAAALLLAVSALTCHADGIGDELGLSPFWNWKQIETPHFRITFPENLTDTAQHAANYLEDANTALTHELHWQPRKKTQILVIDNLDAANGETSPIIGFGIVLYVTPPDDWYSTAYYDNWLRLLCFHEYTHLVNIDTTRGFWQTSRYLFGDVLLPNGAWPPWMLEGLAVYMETRFTHGGRGRSPYYEMVLRSAVDAGVLDTNQFVTLDRVNDGAVPYFPGGETRYLFGYELMNEVAESNHAGPTVDGQDILQSGEDALGVMSYRSGDRIPWFINGNLENITGRNWYDYWDQFVDQTRKRETHDLSVIHSQPVTQAHRLTSGGYLTTGSAISPDGQWLAYSQETLDQINSLSIRNMKTGESRRVAEKIEGAQVSFTPDSKFVLLSSLRREDQYLEYSEIGAYSLEKNSMSWLTHKLRARDPDVSHDGKSVVFTITEGARTSVALAELTEKDGRLQLTHIHKIVAARKYDVISSPKFSKDDQKIYYSIHYNGLFSEELAECDLRSHSNRILVQNRHFNRFPAVSPTGDLYFVSDATGVDNIYRYRPNGAPELVTNFTTGVAFPSFSPDGKIYGAVFSYTGWDLAQIDPLPRAVSPNSVAVAPAPAPTPDAQSDAKPANRRYAVENYSVWPSILPRTWIPYAFVAPSNVSFGEAILGFDAIDRHQYLLDIGYDTLSASLDWLAQYQNRSLGPNLTAVAYNQFSYAVYSGSSVAYYARDNVYSLGATFTGLSTFSSLTPYLALTFDRTSYYTTSALPPVVQTQYLPDLDLLLGYSNTQSTKLSIGPESGRDFVVGGRYFINNGNGSGAVKGLISDTEYYRLGDSHAVLSPSLRASYTSATPSTNPNQNSDVIAQGYYPLVYAGPVLGGIDGLPGTSLSRMPIRGYPYAAFFEKGVATAALDFRFPISNVFRAWGTNPFLLDQIYGTGFAELNYFPGYQAGLPGTLPFLPSAGGGLTANFEMLIQVPLSLAVQYQYGFQKQAFGTGNVIADIGYSGPFF